MDKIINIYSCNGKRLSSLPNLLFNSFIVEHEDGYYFYACGAVCPFKFKTLKEAVHQAVRIEDSIRDVHKKNTKMKLRTAAFRAMKDDTSIDILNQLYDAFDKLTEDIHEQYHLTIRYSMTANEILKDRFLFDPNLDGTIAISSGSFSLSIPRSIKTLLHFISKYESLCGISKRKQRILLL
jgi:hypothetical protein